MTASLLLRTLTPLKPGVDGQELTLGGPPPVHLRPLIPVLQTGLRAMLTNRPWFGIADTGRGVGQLEDGSLDPAKPLPWLTHRLCVAGDAGWDAVPDWWRADFGHLFGPPPKRWPGPHRTSARHCPFIPLGTPLPAAVSDEPNPAFVFADLPIPPDQFEDVP